MAPSHHTPSAAGRKASGFAAVPGFEFSENGNNVVDHYLVRDDKVQPWKQFYMPNKQSAVIEVKGQGTALYCEKGGRGGF